MGHSFTGANGITGAHQAGYSAVIGHTANTGSTLEALYGWEYRLAAPEAAVVLGRGVFYNASRFDGLEAAANARDDAAVATDKTALRPGNKAGFSHYTSYSRGLNGILVDIGGLPGTPTAADFAFATGNTDAVASWGVAPVPASVSVRRGAGVSGSDRITLIWADNAVRNSWLEVRVLATTATGLAADDVFYFGNAVGETGNHAGVDARVDAEDESLARANVRGPFVPASVTDPYDFNRDRQVNATDQILARVNATTAETALRLITPGGVPGPVLAFVPEAGAGAVFAASPGVARGTAEAIPDADAPAVAVRSGSVSGAGVRLEIGRLAGGRLELRLAATEAAAWELQVRGEMGDWRTAPEAAGMEEGGGRKWILDPRAGSAPRFFRLARPAEAGK